MTITYRLTESGIAYAAENLALVHRHFLNEGLNRLDLVVEDYTDDVLWAAPARGLRVVGKDVVRDIYSRMFPNMGDATFETLARFPVETPIPTEGQVLDYSIARFRLTGEGFLPLPVGTYVEMELAHIFGFRRHNGRSQIATEIVYEKWRPLEKVA